MTCLAMQSETSLYRLIRRLHYYQPIKQNWLNLKQNIKFFPISSDQNHGKESSLWNISLFCMKALIFCWKFQDDHKKVHLHFWWERHIFNIVSYVFFIVWIISCTLMLKDTRTSQSCVHALIEIGVRVRWWSGCLFRLSWSFNSLMIPMILSYTKNEERKKHQQK